MYERKTMNTYKYQKIDAFTSGNSLGNPAACIYLDSDQQLNETKMLDIAKQHKGFVSEVIYCKNKCGDICLTYYSSECEVDFCGHGTIACMYSLIKETPALLNEEEIFISTNKKGMITVYNKISELNAVFIAAPTPNFIGIQLGVDILSTALDIHPNFIETKYPIDLIDAGLRTLIVPFNDLGKEISIYPDERNLKIFCESNDIDIILIFSLQTESSTCIAHTRVFAPKFGYLEDPATGSGNSAFGYYMLKNGLWSGTDCVVEQGGNNRIFNKVYLSQIDGKVLFGGSATTRIDGCYYF